MKLKNLNKFINPDSLLLICQTSNKNKNKEFRTRKNHFLYLEIVIWLIKTKVTRTKIIKDFIQTLIQQ